MKYVKKITALLLAVVMVTAMSVTAFATGGGTAYTITVTGAQKGETYTAYKIFDVIYDNGHYNYTITNHTGTGNENEWFDDIVNGTAADPTTGDYTLDAYGIKFVKIQTITAEGTEVYNVVGLTPGSGTEPNPTADQIAALAAELAKHTDGKTAAGSGTLDAGSSETSVVITPDPNDAGYYFVTTTTGSLCALDTTNPAAEVQEKNTAPSVEKTQSATADGNYAEDKLDLSIGDTVYYRLEITDGKGTDKAITVTDTLTEGLTLDTADGAITVTKDGTAVDSSNYTIESKTTQGFTLTLTADYVKTLGENDTVIVKYRATLNENVTVDSETGNSNTATLTYSAQSAESTVYAATYDFLLKKTDGESFVNGAGFKLYDAQTGGNQIAVQKDDKGYYVDQSDSKDVNTEIKVESADGVNVRGLKPGTYYLEETTTPKGYNTLTARQEVTINANAAAAVDVTVVNLTGAELPSTGGTGTAIFYVFGVMLAAGAAVLLITRKRVCGGKR